MGQDLKDISSAIMDFQSARNKAALKEILARIKGDNNRLLSYDEVRDKLKLRGGSDLGLHEIPLDAIVGSVGRYSDFSRDFLPLQDVNEERWARIKVAATGMVGLPPIEVYKIGETYFVKDGNHRVSVARNLGAKFIQAYVTEVRTRVPITPDIKPDDLIIKAEYSRFLEQTRLDELRPDADLTVTVPGKYQILADHIDVHRYFMGLEWQRDISYEEATTHWYDTVYMPIVHIIREKGILRYFPERTETDLYLWIAEHQAAIEEELGWNIQPEDAVIDLVGHYSSQTEVLAARISGKLLDTLTLKNLDAGPPVGEWRRLKEEKISDERLFQEILVPINGKADGWLALDQSLVIAYRENARLHGLHVTPSDEETLADRAQSIREEFNQRCANAGVDGQLVFATGDVSEEICHRSRWTDLVVTNLSYPPGSKPLSRLSSGFRDLIQRCPRPILAEPQNVTNLDRPLLAYDGSSKAQEALYVATYLAAQWQVPLDVVTVISNGHVTPSTLEQAREYLEEHGVSATYLEESGAPVSKTILRVAQERENDLLIVGGYGYSPVLGIVLGTVVDEVLRNSGQPMLICR
jgi:nucleotide-binding universal stress UspA family protein